MADIYVLNNRANISFQYKSITLNNRQFPCIGLFDDNTGILLGVPLFERWLFQLNKAELLEYQTLRKKSYHLCCFLNFLLRNTSCNKISDITLNDLRQFLIAYKVTDDGDPRDPSGWNKCISDIYDFLRNYHSSHKTLSFHFRIDDIITAVSIKNANTRRTSVMTQYHKLSVKPPKKSNKKYRFLPYGYFDLFLRECQKYEPMIALGVALQAYAGLREGEIVNITYDNILLNYGGFGCLSSIDIDINNDSTFVQSENFGHIKKYRTQRVYTDFTEYVFILYKQHESLYSNGTSAVFLNAYGRPMGVQTYTTKVKSVFYDHFLPDLKKICQAENTWAKHAPYIEQYESAYPGGHMFRHWFTMYLLTKTSLTREEISKWRGDSCIESMDDYVHINGDIINWYKKSVYRFQERILEEIL